MSILGDVARVSPAELERLRSLEHAYELVWSDEVPKVDLDRYWDGLRFLMGAAGFPVNPIGGRLFPDEERYWNQGDPHTEGRSLTADEVRQAAAALAATPFEALAAHAEKANDADLYPQSRDWTCPVTQQHTATYYRALVDFFQEAAASGECTISWAA
ncbi:DUF1877 family protein [Longispora sp. K20-0274]|uniref:DUF1877 family protein n=1 Tax=Longispora sp. K20-0274 TaxID=3088255 RepID=UPI00399AD089